MAKSGAKASSDPAPVYDPVEAGFLEARGKLVDLAAFFDRARRHGKANDYRVRALHKALKKISVSASPAHRTVAVLRALSDPTTAPVAQAGPPAAGAYNAVKAKLPPKKKTGAKR